MIAKDLIWKSLGFGACSAGWSSAPLHRFCCLATGGSWARPAFWAGFTTRRGWAEAVAFIAALIAVPALFHYLGSARVETHATSSPVLLIAGGLAVGLGTRLANGCTSGHGVCGISRLSVRGIIATLIYIGAGVATVAGLRALMGGL